MPAEFVVLTVRDGRCSLYPADRAQLESATASYEDALQQLLDQGWHFYSADVRGGAEVAVLRRLDI